MNTKGFTIIELMLTIVIISVIAALAVPSFLSILRKQQAEGETTVLITLVYFARSEAIKRNSVVTICKSNDAQICGGVWSDGWIVFQDTDEDGSRDVSEELISTGVLGNDYKLSWSAFGSDNYVRFTALGLTLSQNGTFKLCPSDGDVRYARAIILSKAARARIPQDTNGDGLYEDASGDNLTCS